MDPLVNLLIGAAAFVIAYIFVQRKIIGGIDKAILKKPKLTKEVDVELKVNEQRARKKVRSIIEGMNITKIEDVEGKIMAILPRTAKSYGEVLMASFTEKDGVTVVNFLSRPAIPFAMSDGGKNQENVDYFLSRIKG